MLNKEFYKNEIYDCFLAGSSFAIIKKENKIYPCDALACSACKFNTYKIKQGQCITKRYEWLNQEVNND